MKKILTIVLLVISAHSSSQSYESLVTAFFNSVTFDENSSTLVFRSEGPRYNFIRYENSDEVYGTIEYGQSMVIEKGQSTRLATRGASIKISDIKEIEDSYKSHFEEWSSVDGWILVYREDLRSFGGAVGISLFIVPVNLSVEQRSTLTAKYSNTAGYIISEHLGMFVIGKTL